MKAAQEFYDELVGAVHPPKGCKIVLRETEPNPSHDFNWPETAGGTPTDTIADVIAELRRQHRRLDWDGVTERDGKWRCITR